MHILITLGTTKRCILLYVHFPIVHPTMTMQLFQIISHPVPINSSSSHTSKIANLPKYVAISTNHAHFVELNEAYIASCTQFGSTKLSSLSLLLTPISLETCSVILLLANTSSINNICEFDFHLNQMTDKRHKLVSRVKVQVCQI